MEIIPFFSFKGGVGRTQAMLNVGAEIARRGRNVVLMDFDIHAPGLSLMQCMQPLPDDPAPRPRPGLLDFLEWLVRMARALEQDRPPEDPIHLPACAYRPQIAEKLPPGSGRLTFVPCAEFQPAADGRPFLETNTEYEQRLLHLEADLESVLATLRQNTGPERLSQVIEQIRAQFESLPDGERPDYILIDSRTGITSIREMVFSASMTRMVLISGLNDQNLWGLRAALQAIQASLGDTPNWLRRIIFLVSPVPEGEATLKEERITRYASVLAEFTDPVEAQMFGTNSHMPEPLGIPYNPQLALIEDPILLRHPREKISQLYREVADQIGTHEQDAIQNLTARFDHEKRIRASHPWFPRVHPIARVPPWDVGLSAAQREAFLGSLGIKDSPERVIFLLNFLANSTVIPTQGKSVSILGGLASVPNFQVQALLENLAEVRKDMFARPLDEWPQIASWVATVRLEWHSQIRQRLSLDIMPPLDALTDENAISAAAWGTYWTSLAAGLRSNGGREEALNLLRRGFARFGGRPDFAWNASHEFIMLDAYVDALEVCKAWRSDSAGLPEQQGRAWNRQAQVHQLMDDLNAASTALHQALLCLARADDPIGHANTLQSLGDLALRQDQLEEAAEYLEAARVKYDSFGDKLGHANTLKSLGDLALRQDQLETAAKHFEAARVKYGELGAKLGHANTLKGLGDLALRQGLLETAAQHFEAARLKFEDLGEKLGHANTLQSLGYLALLQDQLVKAAQDFDAARVKYTEVGDKLGHANTLRSLGDLALRQGLLETAAQHLEAARVKFKEQGEELGHANTLCSLGDLALRQDRLETAAQHFDAARVKYEELGENLGLANTLKLLAEWHLKRSEYTLAARLLEDCLARYKELEDKEGLWETQLLQAELQAAQQQSAKARQLADQVAQQAAAAGFHFLAREAAEKSRAWS